MTIESTFYGKRPHRQAAGFGLLDGAQIPFPARLRQTGKTHLLGTALPEARRYDLLDWPSIWLSANGPAALPGAHPRRHHRGHRRNPSAANFLNEVHRLIEESRLRFSSPDRARGQAEAWRRQPARRPGPNRNIAPADVSRAGVTFRLDRVIGGGGTLPSIYFSDDPRADLAAGMRLVPPARDRGGGCNSKRAGFQSLPQGRGLVKCPIVNFTKSATTRRSRGRRSNEYFAISRIRCSSTKCRRGTDRHVASRWFRRVLLLRYRRGIGAPGAAGCASNAGIRTGLRGLRSFTS